ncbi:LLM class flavin-dependent oxidoreductase [Dehalococcoidia bacterium]|nr:LLM class flavin-dependent oxidoreductase [Dehalococcoidia bacterium]
MASLKFGITAGGPGMPSAAKQAEALGYDSVWMGEHVVFRHPTYDAMMLLAAASVLTTKIRLGTSILLLPLKHPVLVAKAATTLDIISEGRAALGIGIGGEYAAEFDAVAVPISDRGARANESISVMKRLWTEENVTFEGKFFQMKDISLDPKPVQRPHPPILVGGRRGALERTAKYGDGWMPYLLSVNQYRDWWGKIEELCHGHGRDPAEIERTLFIFTTIGDTYESAAKVASAALGNRYAQNFDSMIDRFAIVGTPQQCAERVHQYREAGVQHFIFAPNAPPEQSALLTEMIAQELIPAVLESS